MELKSFSAHFLIILYICTKFCENISKGFKVIERTLFPNKICKGAFPEKCRSSYGSAHRLITLYICTKIRENISKAFKVFEQTRFPNRNFPRGIIQKTVSGVMFLFFAHHLILLYICTKFCENISKGFRSYSILKFAKRHISI